MTNKNQHWVPKFLIKNFADADGRVFCLDIQTNKITKPPPRHAASCVGFNEFLIDGGAVSFENQLEKIETQAAPILVRIVKSRSVSGLTDKQRKRVANFIAIQSFRTDAFYKGMELKVSREQFGSIFTNLWRSAFLVSDEIERRKWAVMVIESDDVFYLGDHPVVLQFTENPSAGGELGFDIQGVEAFLPLAPKCALYMPSISTGEEIISGYEKAIWLHRQFHSRAPSDTTFPGANSDLLCVTQRVMQNSQALYLSLTKGGAFTATSENIENLNYLQCAWAQTAIYSNRRDFTFAKRVFSESPQYRKSPRTSLGIVEKI